MAQLSDFISRIFSAERTQGLSGGAEVVVDQDPASAFYAARLRKHRTDEDLVTSPEYLWATPSYGGRKGGLRAHIQAEKGDGVAAFTDVLVVINRADAERISLAGADGWAERAARGLSARFGQWAQGEHFELLYPNRPLGFRFVADGSPEMLGQSLGLGPGEYVTGLLPNFYVAPGPESRPVLAVHLNIPGAWEGYREVGRLYHDQVLFTLGRHWLDNYHHPALREPGLYRLQQYPDGSLVHVISPEVQDRYLVRSDSVSGGASVLTISEWSGEPVAYLVLAVVEDDQPAATSVEVAEEPSAPPPAPAPAPASAEPVTTELAAREMRAQLQRTIVPGAIESRILTLQERGALLQKVHFANFMEGYDVYIGPNGRVGTQMHEPKAVLQVRGSQVSLHVQSPGVMVGGRAITVGKTIPLRGETAIEVDGNRILYRDLTGVRADGWPYLAELRRPGASAYLEFGNAHRIGRDRRCKVRLPDEPHNDNITWLPTVGGGTTIRSRTGDIPKSRFYTDSIMVASEHAEVDLGQEPALRSLARHCYTYVRRNGEVLALYPREGAGGRQEVELAPNDEVLVGNCLFQVSFLAAGQAAPSAPSQGREAPRIQLSAGDLARAVDTEPPLQPAAPAATDAPVPAPSILPNAQGTNEPKPTPKPESRLTVDPAVAAGLGEPGPAPRPAAVPGAEARHRGKPPPPMLIETFEGFPVRESQPSPKASGAHPVPTAQADAPPAAPPPAPASPAPSASPVPASADGPLADPPESEDPVLSVEEAQWTLELSRPARLVQRGWMLSGEVLVGNHKGAQIVVPEVRAFPEQAFMTLDYFRLMVRGRKGKAHLLQEGEARIERGGREVPATDGLDDVKLCIVRRDANLEPDFDIVLHVIDEPLPDPRARLLQIDTDDRLVAALFTLGLPLRAPRRVRLGPLVATVQFDGDAFRVSDYLASYRYGENKFRPFFLRQADGAYQTLPEDGSPLTLHPGDRLIAGALVYELQTG